MLGAANHLVLRDRIDRGELFGPRLFVYGPAMNGQSTPTPEIGSAQVREYKQAGYDGLKIHEGLSLATFEAIARAAKLANVPFAGHVPNDVGVERALAAGQKSIEHLDVNQVLALQNGTSGRYMFVFSSGSWTNMMDMNSIGESFLRAPDGGAVFYVGKGATFHTSTAGSRVTPRSRSVRTTTSPLFPTVPPTTTSRSRSGAIPAPWT